MEVVLWLLGPNEGISFQDVRQGANAKSMAKINTKRFWLPERICMLFRETFLSTLEQCMYRAVKSQLVLFFSRF